MIGEPDITTLLNRASGGDRVAESDLLDRIYANLRQIARRVGKDSAEQDTLSTTALANESYLRLFGSLDMDWANRRQFFAYAARAMRNLLLDRARHSLAQKRGGQLARDDDALDQLVIPFDGMDVMMADQALVALDKLDSRMAQVVEMHVFAGMGFADIAAHLEIGERTALRDWKLARLTLQNIMAN